jgi:hypothetical protein
VCVGGGGGHGKDFLVEKYRKDRKQFPKFEMNERMKK